MLIDGAVPNVLGGARVLDGCGLAWPFVWWRKRDRPLGLSGGGLRAVHMGPGGAERANRLDLRLTRVSRARSWLPWLRLRLRLAVCLGRGVATARRGHRSHLRSGCCGDR